MKELQLSANYNDISIHDFLTLTFISIDFKYKFHTARGDTDIVVGEWKEIDGVQTRVSTFCSTVSGNSLVKKLTGGMNPLVQETQRYTFPSKDRFTVTATTAFQNFSMGDSFNSITVFTVTATSPTSVRVVIDGKNEYKGRVFKGQIEQFMHQSAVQTFEVWMKLVSDSIASRKAEFRAPSEYTRSASSSRATTPSPYETASEFSDNDDDEFYDTLDVTPPSPSVSSINQKQLQKQIQEVQENQYNSRNNISYNNNSNSNAQLPSSALIDNIHHELNQVKSMMEVNSSRLLGLESAFANMPSSSPSKPNGTPNQQNGRYPSSNSSSNGPAANQNNVLPYLQRLDALIKQQQDDEQRMAESEADWKKKFDDMEEKMNRMNNRNGTMGAFSGSWSGFGMVVFIIVWPFVAQKFWRYAKVLKPIVGEAISKILNRK
eukprot:TRINITY_DN2481_c0_g1_i1.p1 TRINITY_DN2481_c0_g1~~TRINITY_DN2481_c0_g1_i1.p1  ORF type:complete len:433 (-),score=122.51 TRINITY_DN2481_c0_g1_i1:53-1351(-)